MPANYEITKSWADEVEDEGSITLPPPTVVYENDFKIMTEYKLNDDNKKVKVVRTYKIERRTVSKTIAVRKNWSKYGDSLDDGPGPNPATTVIAEDVFMQFLSSKEEENKVEEDSLDKLKSMGDKGVVKCRNCNGEHWTSKCPFKDTVLGGLPDDKKLSINPTAGVPGMGDMNKPQGSKYIPPSMRDGGNKRGDSMLMQRRDDTTAIRISNLSENTTDTDLEELVKKFGAIHKFYLAKEKNTNVCKGFAYVHYKTKEDAARAINGLHGHGYDYLILSVDWSKPPAQNN
ncbi:PREDICTED: eukaryotic translation initiation factor 3 subunit G-like [Ceratosolen solmsi marchali]|uniref:Eukaryotic translation initiation factor 3 subunit G n=1 Tax=Ceratosolen solmsi marchali TaxID=326594 RepID=A0AAJ6YJH1_9HYME|nr:PREDICTED: eukaryotic translation initiation factor 3 subunit G-like [Ceratosolen solmsi marchali]